MSITKPIYNSSGKVVGQIEKTNQSIVVNNNKKPLFLITDKRVVSLFEAKEITDEDIIYLWDEYILNIGEIAAIVGVEYSNINKRIKKLSPKTPNKFGRRNSSYGATFSEERKKNISEGEKRAYKENGFYAGRYERTKEIREKTSLGVKAAYERGDLDGAKNARKGWGLGKFSNVNFKRGIGGYITSQKTNRRFFFRSLLELCFILKLEKDDSVYWYEYEPFYIECDDGSLYTPDFLINDKYLVELKSYGFIYKQKGKIQSDFEKKCKNGEKYAEANNMVFMVIFDKDIGFDSAVYKHIIRESKDLDTYNIEFLQPERVWSEK